MDPAEFNNFVFQNYFLLNYLIIKIDTYTIKHKLNIKMFVRNSDNLIEQIKIIYEDKF
jgi:hypothetical protein